jgi:AbiJ N-terminal domain 4
MPDIYVYDTVPNELRVQVVQVMHEVLGSIEDAEARRGGSCHDAYQGIVTVLRKELGTFQLPPKNDYAQKRYAFELSNFMLTITPVEGFLDAVELVCRVIENVASEQSYWAIYDAREVADSAILEINARFREHAVGYEYDGELVRIDTELLHAEAAKPALSLLREPRYKGAEEEFLKAYEHYRKGHHKEALYEALKAFESTMKSICEKRKWTYGKNDAAAKLLTVCFDNGLIPDFWQSHFNGFRTSLEAGVPTGRNKLSGHGQGATPIVVPNHIAAEKDLP